MTDDATQGELPLMTLGEAWAVEANWHGARAVLQALPGVLAQLEVEVGGRRVALGVLEDGDVDALPEDFIVGVLCAVRVQLRDGRVVPLGDMTTTDELAGALAVVGLPLSWPGAVTPTWDVDALVAADLEHDQADG